MCRKGTLKMEKIRCLIIDDEELVIQRLSLFFDSLQHPQFRFELAGKAYAGDEGLEAAIRLKPDIVITDIRMPGMDGITMIERIRETMPDLVFIILTAYSDFNYAKRAIQSNVSDYIIKVPLDEEELLRSLGKAASSVIAVKNEKDRLQRLNISILENRHRILKQFFHELIRGELNMRHAKEIATNLDMQMFHGHYCCVVIEMNRYVHFMNQYPLSDQSILKYGMLNIIEETIGLHGGGFAFGAEEHRFVGFVQWPISHSQAAHEKRYEEVGQAIIQNLRGYLSQPVSVGFSAPRKGWPELTSAYLQARRCCDESYYSASESVHTPAHIQAEGKGDVKWPGSQLQDILQLLHRNADRKEIAEGLSAFEAQARERRLPRTAMNDLLKDFLLEGKNRILKWKQALPEAGEELLPFMRLNDQMAFIGHYLEKSLMVETLPARPEIAKALAYIESHLTERLSLQTIAEQANLAPAYFSSLFKREMKESLVDYINRKKIERAVELLQQQHYTLQELCDMVGILNEAYFCTLFKQKTGKTPGQFRKKN